MSMPNDDLRGNSHTKVTIVNLIHRARRSALPRVGGWIANNLAGKWDC